MVLTLAQIQSLLNEARANGLDADEVKALEWRLTDQAAQLSGADRLDVAFALADDEEQRAIETFMQAATTLRQDAITRGVATLNAISEDEWERLINGDV